MVIISDERNEKHANGLCHDCKQTKPVRSVRVLDWMTRESRGFYNICFDCFGPRVFWKKTHGDTRVFETPVTRPAC